ncbi:hypothetical protein V8C43DRAFT_274369 [Trichoderma afarasin]
MLSFTRTVRSTGQRIQAVLYVQSKVVAALTVRASHCQQKLKRRAWLWPTLKPAGLPPIITPLQNNKYGLASDLNGFARLGCASRERA